MPSSPRIYRVDPVDPVTTATSPIPVIATLHWVTAPPEDIPALAVGWTAEAVQIEWTWDNAPRRDWLSASDVRRPGQPPKADTDPDEPLRLATRKRRRW